MSYEVHYAENSDQAVEFSSDFQNIDWDSIGCEVSFSADGFDSLDETVEYCNTLGLGIFYLYDDDVLKYLVRVTHGAAPEVREPNTNGY